MRGSDGQGLTLAPWYRWVEQRLLTRQGRACHSFRVTIPGQSGAVLGGIGLPRAGGIVQKVGDSGLPLPPVVSSNLAHNPTGTDSTGRPHPRPARWTSHDFRQFPFPKIGESRRGRPIGFGWKTAEAAALKRIRQLRRKPKGAPRLSVAAIAALLNAEAIPTRQGGPWRPSSVHAILRRIA